MASPPYDQAIVDITDYVFHYQIESPKAWQCARTALFDAVGCAIETVSKSPQCRTLLGPIVPGTTTPDGFRLPGTLYEIDPVKGAFDMGAMIRYLDHNDALGGAEWGHPSDNIGAILPVMDWLSRASSSGRINHSGPPLTIRTLLTAIIKAYEIQGCYQMRNAFNSYGIDHVILVKLASAAVVSWLLGATELQTMATISQVWMDGHPGRVYRSGANTIPRKGWAAGDACMRAVHLALLTRAGQPGSPSALTMPRWGFLTNTFGTKGFDLPKPFSSWVIQNIFFKVMPVEGHGISSVEAALIQGRRLREKGYGPEHITKVEARTTAAAKTIISKQGRLYNAADRDHCIEYVIALALLKGSIPEIEDYQDGSRWATSSSLESLRAKVIVTEDKQFTREYLDIEIKSVASGLTVHLVDGTVLEEVLVEFPAGHMVNPQTATMVKEKFSRNMGLMFSEMEINEILKSGKDDDMKVSDFVGRLVRQTPVETRASL